jgi:hypothetical protein
MYQVVCFQNIHAHFFYPDNSYKFLVWPLTGNTYSFRKRVRKSEAKWRR